MKEKEFDLSEMLHFMKSADGELIECANSGQIKEFIRRETILLGKLAKGEITIEEYARECDKLAGNKLK